MANPFQGFLTSIKSTWAYAVSLFKSEAEETEERVEADAVQVETYAEREVPAFLRVGRKTPDFQRNIPVEPVGNIPTTVGNMPTASPMPTPQPTLAPMPAVPPGPVVQPDQAVPKD